MRSPRTHSRRRGGGAASRPRPPSRPPTAACRARPPRTPGRSSRLPPARDEARAVRLDRRRRPPELPGPDLEQSHELRRLVERIRERLRAVQRIRGADGAVHLGHERWTAAPGVLVERGEHGERVTVAGCRAPDDDLISRVRLERLRSTESPAQRSAANLLFLRPHQLLRECPVHLITSPRRVTINNSTEVNITCQGSLPVTQSPI